MARRQTRSAEPVQPGPPPPSAEWLRSAEFSANGRKIVKGTELSITGEPGARFKFMEYVVAPKGDWISVVGGRKGEKSWRSFAPERIKRVHRVEKVR